MAHAIVRSPPCSHSLTELTVQQVEDALKNEEAHQVGAVTAVTAATAAVHSGSQTAAPASSLVCAFCVAGGA